MNFLVLVVAVITTELLGPQAALQRDYWFGRWASWLAARPGVAAQPVVLNMLRVLLPVLALAVVLYLFGGWLFGLVGAAINLLVLLYAVGRGAVDESIALYRDELARGDVQGAWHDAAGFDTENETNRAESWRELHDGALAAASYHYFERYFPVLLWFVLLGAPGALLYRLASLAAATEPRRDGGFARNLLWLLEWIPLRLVGLILALVGNFSATMGAWRERFFSVADSTADMLAALVRGALLADALPSPAEGAREIDAVAALFRRALILSLGLIALLELL